MKSYQNTEEDYLALCKQQVEVKLCWGSSDTWSHADFLEASEKISEEAGMHLSVTTIKRLWGKVQYSSSPANATLNALAIFLGYKSWRDFKLAQDDIKDKENQEKGNLKEKEENTAGQSIKIRNPESKLKKRKNLLVPYLTALVVLTSALYFLSSTEKDNEILVEGDVVFNSEPVSSGLPNTVVFNYDISAYIFDSAFIQQNWDYRRRQKIEKENKQMTSVYYYPGHFHAKLVLNDQVIKEHGLLIPTEGWLGIIDGEGFDFPEYIFSENLNYNKSLHASPVVLQSKKVDTRKSFQLAYSNVQDFRVDGDNFILETAIKNNLEEGGQMCQESGFLLDGESGIIMVPFSAPGCVGNLGLQFGDMFINGKTTDLSVLGTDLSKWNRVRYAVKDKNAAVYLNDKLIYETTYNEPVGTIMGINFKFHGAGAVDFVRLKDAEGKVIYEDEFE
ncbi:MAG: hypothetical protein M3512_08830 [Bacteroidota bacterium]|nr:hypothetical protein [Bacteroidota bacterium]